MLDTVMNDAGANSRFTYAVPQHISGHIERPIPLIQVVWRSNVMTK